jgi:hypothetical protein
MDRSTDRQGRRACRRARGRSPPAMRGSLMSNLPEAHQGGSHQPVSRTACVRQLQKSTENLCANSSHPLPAFPGKEPHPKDAVRAIHIGRSLMVSANTMKGG